MFHSSCGKAAILSRILLLYQLICFATAAELIDAWDWNNESQPISIFRSRPDLLAPILTPLEGIHQRDKMAPGYFFVAPYMNMQPGIYIYDNNADLVYTSYGSYGPGISHAPKVCQYHGKPHLCYYQGVQMVGWGHGHGVIMDQNYRVVRSIEPSCTYQASSDMHEFYLNDDGTRAYMTQYVRQVHDLCSFGLCDGLGYIHTSQFQEIDVETGACLFSWNSLDHVGAEESFVLPDTTEISGDGESPETPWDYFHINSVDKSTYDGGFLISARHVSAIYKLDGKTGEIRWRLGGAKNEFEYNNEFGNIDFGFQHDARWISDSDDESVISLYDNGSNGYTETARFSTGKIIRLNHRTKTASLVEAPLDPPFIDGHAHLSKSQGNFQMNLPGARNSDVGGVQVGMSIGNRILGYGNDPFFSEYAWTVTKDDITGEERGFWEKVFYGTLAWGYMMNYRVLKYDGWVGVPLTKPALWSFSKYGMNHTIDNDNTMVLYASWNGHTQIDTYMFYGANTESARHDQSSADWEVLIGGFKKKGFETIYKHPNTYKYVYVQAFDKGSVSLGKSQVITTFVPNPVMREHYCDELACTWMDTNNDYREKMRVDMKKAYDEYTRKKGSDVDYEADIYDSIYHKMSGPSPAKILTYGLSFGLLGIVISMVFILAARRFTSIHAISEKTLSILRIRTRKAGQSERGRYFGLQGHDLDATDDDELREPDGRSTQHDLEDLHEDSGLNAERQAYSKLNWRVEPP